VFKPILFDFSNPLVSYGGCSLKKIKKIQTIYSIEFFVIKQSLSSQFIQLESAAVVQNEWKKNNKSSSDKNSLELAIKVLLNVGHWCSITNSYASSKHPCVTTCSVPETSIHTISPSIKIIQIELR
jgi:hypothetical protein